MSFLKSNSGRAYATAASGIFKSSNRVPFACIRQGGSQILAQRSVSTGIKNLLAEFVDDKENYGKYDLRPLFRPGRAWSANELRLKSNSDLHKLWYVLLKEKNMLLTMMEAYSKRAKFFPNPERLDRVAESMTNIETVVHERNDALLQLETGDHASPPMRSVTSFMGFTYKKQATEHYAPFEVSGEKEYEVPYLDDDAYAMQKLWSEKEFMKKEVADYDAYFNKVYDRKNWKFGRTLQKSYNRLEDLPKSVLAADNGDAKKPSLELESGDHLPSSASPAAKEKPKSATA